MQLSKYIFFLITQLLLLNREIGKCPNPFLCKITKCQILFSCKKVFELQSVRIIKNQNRKVSESDDVRTAKSLVEYKSYWHSNRPYQIDTKLRFERLQIRFKNTSFQYSPKRAMAGFLVSVAFPHSRLAYSFTSLLHTRLTLSQLRNFKFHCTTFLNFIKLADLPIFWLWICERAGRVLGCVIPPLTCLILEIPK